MTWAAAEKPNPKPDEGGGEAPDPAA